MSSLRNRMIKCIIYNSFIIITHCNQNVEEMSEEDTCSNGRHWNTEELFLLPLKQKKKSHLSFPFPFVSRRNTLGLSELNIFNRSNKLFKIEKKKISFVLCIFSIGIPRVSPLLRYKFLDFCAEIPLCLELESNRCWNLKIFQKVRLVVILCSVNSSRAIQENEFLTLFVRNSKNSEDFFVSSIKLYSVLYEETVLF